MNRLSICFMGVMLSCRQETAFIRPWSPYLIDLDDYRTELIVGLSESWKQAKQNVCKAQAKQKKYYDHHSKEMDFKIEDRVMVYIYATRSARKES